MQAVISRKKIKQTVFLFEIGSSYCIKKNNIVDINFVDNNIVDNNILNNINNNNVMGMFIGDTE